ncbi:tyrosine-type recombinase/integrase [Streptomyces sp. NPDC007346]|uniref:site-specific integrase n=1 Tax=Streptomyces sp. NPDC007346 TaxID=3154682 RepID=UPI003456D230
MSGSRRAGGITKRCECRDEAGKRLGLKCPQLAKKNHGNYQVRQELPAAEDGTRRIFRRTGYDQVKDAQKDLNRIGSLLDLADEDDEEAARRIGDLLMVVMKDREKIPDITETKRRIAAGVLVTSKMTMADLLDEYVELKKKTRKRRTGSGYESHVRVHLRPGLGRFRVDRLTVAHCQAFFDDIVERNEVVLAENRARREQEARCKWGKGGRPPHAEAERLAAEREKLAAMPPYRLITGAATRQRIRATLRGALNLAIRKQLITFNAAQWVELASGKRPKPLMWTAGRVEQWERTGERPSPVMVWTPVQLGRFLDEAERSRLYAFFHLVALRGYRRGEGVGQGWDEVDLDGGFITPSRELIVDNWQVFEDSLKTEESMSTIALDSLNVGVLRAHRARQLAERDSWNRHAAAERAQGKDVADWVDLGKVFVEPDGTWLHPEKVSDEFHRIRIRAGLPPINLRDLRHIAATLVHAGGGDIHAVGKTLRHTTIQLASDTYTELLAEVDRGIAEAAAALVPRARKGAGKVPGEQSGGEVSMQVTCPPCSPDARPNAT